MGTLLRGLWSGLFATSTMTMVMMRLYQWLPRARRGPLPPATLTKSLLSKTGLKNELSEPAQMESTLLSHSAFGASCGVVYSILAPHIRGNSILKGSLFGLGVWGLSYLGWIPAMNLRPKGTRMNSQQNAMMVLSHIVWGASLGYLEREFRRSGKKMLSHPPAF